MSAAEFLSRVLSVKAHIRGKIQSDQNFVSS